MEKVNVQKKKRVTKASASRRVAVRNVTAQNERRSSEKVRSVSHARPRVAKKIENTQLMKRARNVTLKLALKKTKRSTKEVVSPFKMLFTYPRIKSITKNLLAVVLMLGLNGFGVMGVGYTIGVYNDSEQSLGNLFKSGEVDFLLENSTFTPTTSAISLAPGLSVSKEIVVVPEDSNPFKYVASSTNFSGDEDFCSAIGATMSVEGEEAFDGFLSELKTNATTTLDSWELTLEIATSTFQNSICNFDTEYGGSQTRHDLDLGDGYSDVEVVSHSVSSWGFRIDKVYADVDRIVEIPPIINQCPARSQGYWGTHDGCFGGAGSSIWESDVNDLSGDLLGAFSSMSGSQMCVIMNVPSCPSGNTYASNLCKAQNKVLADEMNVVAGNLDLNAIIDGADDGNDAFDFLGLNENSTIEETLIVLEAVLIDGSSSIATLKKVAHVAERVYSFYEDENDDAPLCKYSEEYLEPDVYIEIEGENEWVEIYNQTDVPLDINGWEICDGASCDVLSASTSIPSMGYGVIVASTTSFGGMPPAFWYLPPDVPLITIPDSNIGDGLDNDADMLLLKRPDGHIIDQMNWGAPDTGWTNYNTDVWNPGTDAADAGNVLARVPSGYDTNDASDFVELIPPSVDLIFPDETGAYKWYWGETYDIEWVATNNNGDDSDLTMTLFYIADTNLDVELSPGDTVSMIISETENDGLYSWTVPFEFVGNIWIYVVATAKENPLLNSWTLSAGIYDPPAETVTIALPEESEAEIEIVLPLLEGETLGQSLLPEESEEAGSSSESETATSTGEALIVEEGESEGGSGGGSGDTPTETASSTEVVATSTESVLVEEEATIEVVASSTEPTVESEPVESESTSENVPPTAESAPEPAIEPDSGAEPETEEVVVEPVPTPEPLAPEPEDTGTDSTNI